MTGLRQYERDADLPALGGDSNLVPLPLSEVQELVEGRLLTRADASITSMTWQYARWKPGVSTTVVHSIRWSDDSEQLVTVKRYADGKAAQLDNRWARHSRLFDLCAPLRPSALFPDRGLALSVFPADRRLSGAVKLLDPRRTARLLEASRWCEERSIRKRRLEFELLRFKPEHRAVYALQVQLRSQSSGKQDRALAARVLSPPVLRRIVSAREQLERHSGFDLTPRIVATDLAAGLLYETWLEVDLFEPGTLASFEESQAAGELLGRLHSYRPEQFMSPQLQPDHARAELFRHDPKLAQRALLHTRERSSASSVWRHGDFHPDQIGRSRADGQLRLLDLDELSIGDPADDLASWIADRLALDPDCEFREAAGELLEGYRREGGERLSTSELTRATADALVGLAAGALRRLEVGAQGKARRLIDLADQLNSSASLSRCRP